MKIIDTRAPQGQELDTYSENSKKIDKLTDDLCTILSITDLNKGVKMQLKSFINKTSVTYYTELKGARIIVLEGRLESRNDMPRLYKLARERLQEISNAMHMQKAA